MSKRTRKPWTEVDLNMLRDHYHNVRSEDLAAVLGHHASEVRNKAAKLGLKKDKAWIAETARRTTKARRWTPQQEALLRAEYASTPTAELAPRVGMTVDQCNRKAVMLGIKKDKAVVAQMARERSGPDHPMRQHTFKPGNVPANKGKRMPEGWSPGRMAQTQFKKGVRPHTWQPVGTQVVNTEGYLDEKVADGTGPRHLFWKPVHRLVWERHHGPIPEGHIVVFKPGRKTTDPALITVDALELLTRAENMRRNSFRANWPPELQALVTARACLTRAIRKKTREQAESTTPTPTATPEGDPV